MKTEEKYQEFLNELRELLTRHGVTSPHHFMSVKFTGTTIPGTSTYLAAVPYIVQNNQVHIIVLPYQRKDDAQVKEKMRLADDIATVRREVRWTIGFNPAVNSIYELIVIPYEGHEKKFYAFEMPIGRIQRMFRFEGFNHYDSEKGMPFLVGLHDIWRFLPKDHLKAAMELLERLRRRHSDGIDDVKEYGNDPFLQYCDELGRLMQTRHTALCYEPESHFEEGDEETIEKLRA